MSSTSRFEGRARLSPPRDRNDPDIRILLAHALDCLEAFLLRHDDVADDEIELSGAEGFPALLAVQRELNSMPLLLERMAHQLHKELVVINHKNPRHFILRE